MLKEQNTTASANHTQQALYIPICMQYRHTQPHFNELHLLLQRKRCSLGWWEMCQIQLKAILTLAMGNI